MTEKNCNDNLEEFYKLSQEEHNIVLEKIKNMIFSKESSSKQSSIMFVIGQPGCGKTTYIENSFFNKDYVIINSDEYRHFHKYSKEILEKEPTYYAKLTNYDVHLWGDELFSYALLNGYNVLREKAPTDLSLIELIKEIKKDNEVVIDVVISGNLNSLLSTRERYEKEIKTKPNAKLSNIAAHNKCYQILSEFISLCLSLNVNVNYVVYEKEEYKIIPVRDNYLSLLEYYRNESNSKTCLDFEKRLNFIKNSMYKRNANKEEFLELQKMEDLFKEIIKENENVRK